MGFFIALLLLGHIPQISLAHAEARDPWTLTVEGDGYRIFKKPSVRSSDLVAFRVIGVLNASPKEVATAILDRDHRMQWMRDVRELRTVRLPKPGSVVEYSAVKTPFVIKDRDFVIRSDVSVDLKKQRIVILSKSVIEEDAPPTSAIRGELVEGEFVLEPGTKEGTTQITADMDVDPKGSVPRWIVNHFQQKWPANMFRALRHFLGRKVATLPTDLQPIFTATP
jgi:hypothetical protein